MRTMSWACRRKKPSSLEGFITLDEYCQLKFITRFQATTLIRKRALEGYKIAGRWWVYPVSSFPLNFE
jgi:hypothetical protein